MSTKIDNQTTFFHNYRCFLIVLLFGTARHTHGRGLKVRGVRRVREAHVIDLAVTCGVPQGSVLGPHISNLPNSSPRNYLFTFSLMIAYFESDSLQNREKNGSQGRQVKK